MTILTASSSTDARARAARLRRWLAGALVLAALAAADVARAAPSEARRAAAVHDRAGKRLYQMGRFPEAIAEFEQAYEIDPHPSHLFNMAQAHRHNKNPEKAIFFFRQFLMRSPNAKERDLVHTRLRELEEQVARTPAPTPARVPPPATPLPQSAPYTPPPPPPPPPLASAASEDTRDLATYEDPAIASEATPPAPRGGHFRLLAELGAALPKFIGPSKGGAPDSSGAVFSGLVSGSYAIPLRLGALDLGLGAAWMPLPYSVEVAREGMAPTTKAGTTHMIGGFALATLRFALGEAVSLGPSIGFGMVWWEALFTGNPFTNRGEHSASVPMPSVRLSAPLTFRVGPRFVLGFQPTMVLSYTTGYSFEGRISQVLSFGASVVAGVEL